MNQSQNDISEKDQPKAKAKANAKAKAKEIVKPIVEEAKQTSLLQSTEGSMEVVPATKKNANANANAKAKKNNKDKESTGNLGAVPEGALASAFRDVSQEPKPDALTSENRQDSGIRFCPVCRYYLYLEVSGEDQSLHRLCRNCGHREEDTKGGMVMEMMVQERSAEGYKILLNEFTRQDPRLPHIRKNIKCPEPTCDSNHGKKDPDIIYIKYDAVNMLYLYICDICGFQWRSARS
jgi:DNA-directed RNA polymerase subunit M/transcription elongation factor TFIIS